MKNSSILFLIWFLMGVLLFAQAVKPPDTMVFKAKTGDVSYGHKQHVDLVKGDCKQCHDKLWPQAKGDLKYKAAMHKTAEASKTSCAACHVAGGTAFASKGNCQKCHKKAGAAKAD